MMRAYLVLALCACGGAPHAPARAAPPAVTAAQSPAPAPVEWDPVPPGRCHETDSVEMSLARKPYEVTLVQCRRDDDEHHTIAGKVGQLVVHGAGEEPRRRTMWRWTELHFTHMSHEIAGVLVGPAGSDLLLVRRAMRKGPEQHRHEEYRNELHMYVFEQDWKHVDLLVAEHLDVHVDQDRHVAHVAVCNQADIEVRGLGWGRCPPGAGGRTLRWNGRNIEQTAVLARPPEKIIDQRPFPP